MELRPSLLHRGRRRKLEEIVLDRRCALNRFLTDIEARLPFRLALAIKPVEIALPICGTHIHFRDRH